MNVRFCSVDAVWAVEHLVAPASVAELWTFFPDPWPKTRHHKRRLVDAPFAGLAASRLAPGATWRLATDWGDYAHQMQAVLYRDQPYIMLWNDRLMEAHTSDWTGFTPQPDPDGDWLAGYGPLSFISIRPVSGTSAGSGGASGGVSAGVWIAILAAVVIIVSGALLMRRRREADEDEA